MGMISRSPRGERGLKYTLLQEHHNRPRRSPRGERGLKCCVHEASLHDRNVAPLAGSVD